MKNNEAYKTPLAEIIAIASEDVLTSSYESTTTTTTTAVPDWTTDVGGGSDSFRDPIGFYGEEDIF